VWEQSAEDRQDTDPEGAAASRQHAQAMRDAMTFFDEIGWLTPLRLREEV
jgi:hypothetical protein